MTTDDEEPPIVTIVQSAAERVATRLCDELSGQGWDYVFVSVARVVEHDGKFASPGASANSYRKAIVPGLGNEAAALRHMATVLDKAADSATKEEKIAIESGYVYEKGGW